MSITFLAWRAPSSRRWYPVGRLESDAGPAGDGRGARAADAGTAGAAGSYRFTYTQGARQAERDAGFAALASFPEFDARYTSATLFPLFANRLLPKSRPEYPSYFEWLAVSEAQNDPLALLARSGGQRQTDEFELYASPEPDAHGEVRLHCFVHGVRYFAAAQEQLDRLHPGDELLLAHDFQNSFDPNAIIVRTSRPGPGETVSLGFLPRYVAPEVHALRHALGASNASRDLRAVVERVNPPSAPLALRLLCRVTAPWPAGYRPFADDAHQPLPVSREVEVAGRARRPAAVAAQPSGVESA